MTWNGPPIDVVSLGVGDPGTLSRPARAALEAAAHVVGARRHFEAIEPLAVTATRVPFPSPMSRLPEVLATLAPGRVAVLASGDALLYGIGRLLISLLGREHLRFHPNISSVQACFHATGLDWRDAVVVSLHGRPCSELRRHLAPGALLAVLTDGDANPAAIAAELAAQGLGASAVWVCESMGSVQESITHLEAAALAREPRVFRDPNVCLLRLRGRGRLPVFPGIPDDHFATGAAPGFGMISKREVRLAILSFMQPAPGETAWDIGAGCGGVSVEWARWNRTGTIYAIEAEPQRVEHLQTNCSRFGVAANCHIVAGRAPEACDNLPDPDCVFIGGSGGALATLVDLFWPRLAPGGRLVASAVTGASRSTLADTWRTFSGQGAACEWSQLAVTKNLPGAMETRRLEPVALLRCTKPGGGT